jgi:hypothetical protein
MMIEKCIRTMKIELTLFIPGDDRCKARLIADD